MTATIELENMEFRAGHGCYDLEKVVGNRFRVDVVLEVEAGEAAEQDDLTKSVSYLTVYEVVRREMALTSNILENVALRVCRALKDEFPKIEKVTAKISKMAPPLGGKIERVSVTLTL